MARPLQPGKGKGGRRIGFCTAQCGGARERRDEGKGKEKEGMTGRLWSRTDPSYKCHAKLSLCWSGLSVVAPPTRDLCALYFSFRWLGLMFLTALRLCPLCPPLPMALSARMLPFTFLSFPFLSFTFKIRFGAHFGTVGVIEGPFSSFWLLCFSFPSYLNFFYVLLLVFCT